MAIKLSPAPTKTAPTNGNGLLVHEWARWHSDLYNYVKAIDGGSGTGILKPVHGGTGVANNNSSTITISGAYGLTLTLTAATSVTMPLTGLLATTSNTLGDFAATTSAQLASVISDETGTGALVFATSPTLVTPEIGAATGTSLTLSSLTSGRVVLASTSGLLADDADLTFSGDTLTATKIVGSTSITDSGLTAGRIVFAGASGLLTDDSDLTFATDTLTATKIIGSTSITDSGLTAGRVTFAGAAGLLTDDADFTFATDTLTVTKIIGSTSITDSGLTAGRVTFAGTAGILSDDADLTFTTDTLSASYVSTKGCELENQASAVSTVATKHTLYSITDDVDYIYVRLANGDIKRIPLSYLAEDAWINGTSYTTTDIVTFGGFQYLCIQATSSDLPTDTDYWTRFYSGMVLLWKAEDTPNANYGGVNFAWHDAPATYSTGVSGKAFDISFNAGDYYGLSAGNNALFNFAAAGTFSIRFYLKMDTTTNYQTLAIVSKGRMFGFDWGVGVSVNGTLGVFTGVSTLINASYQFTDSTWHEVLVSYNAGAYKVYVDDVDVTGATLTANTYLCANTVVDLYLCTTYLGNCDVHIDELSIYNSVKVPADF